MHKRPMFTSRAAEDLSVLGSLMSSAFSPLLNSIPRYALLSSLGFKTSFTTTFILDVEFILKNFLKKLRNHYSTPVILLNPCFQTSQKQTRLKHAQILSMSPIKGIRFISQNELRRIFKCTYRAKGFEDGSIKSKHRKCYKPHSRYHDSMLLLQSPLKNAKINVNSLRI